MKFGYGVDALVSDNPYWKNKKLGLVTNTAARNVSGENSVDFLIRHGFNLIKLFSPEHGFKTDGKDGAYVKNSTEIKNQLPIISLYGNYLKPCQKDVDNVDIMLFDIPDIGCRFYTYLWTLTYVMESCAEYNKPLIILDRPNPISGILDLAEGNLLDEDHCSSFIGRWSIPIRHSCTLGELALYFNHTRNIGANIQVVACKGWTRNVFMEDIGVPFTPPSPAIQSTNATLLYPGLGLLEATNVSEARGTSYPFEKLGAPWLEAQNVIDKLKSVISTENISMCTTEFTPQESKYEHTLCRGIQFSVIRKEFFHPVFFVMTVIKIIKDLHPSFFRWSTYPTMVNPSGQKHLDKLLGVKQSELLFNLDMDVFLDKINFLMATSTAHTWEATIVPFLLYDNP